MRHPEDATTAFLRGDLFIVNTFTSLTSFLEFGLESNLAGSSSGPFLEYFKLLNMVTRLERQSFMDVGIIHNSVLSPKGFQQLFENARASALKLSADMKFPQPDDRFQFSRIVNFFYHAGLIYTYRALFSFPTPSIPDLPQIFSIAPQIATSTSELFQILKALETDKPISVQDLV